MKRSGKGGKRGMGIRVRIRGGVGWIAGIHVNLHKANIALGSIKVDALL